MTSMMEAHFCGTASQSSIYGLTSLFTGENSYKVLIASSKRKVYCTEYSKNQQSVIFSTREVQFTYIPGRAEIISIDAFNQACHVHDFVVGITFTKSDNGGKKSQYFNIYSDWEPSNECDLDNIAQGCLSICLDFIPFHLTHTELSINGAKEVVWLLSGSDCRIHLYREDKSRQTYSEEPSDICFPELQNLTSVVLWMDFITSEHDRITALGCKDGSVVVTQLKLTPDIYIVSSWQIQHDGPISVVKLFWDSSLKHIRKNFEENFQKEVLHINLLVGNTLEVSVVYRDVLNKGLCLSSQWCLPNSIKYDCVTSGLVADINMDGKNELLLGTYGQKLLFYKWEEMEGERGKYSMFHEQMFPNPLLAMNYIDITSDGLNELIVLTTKGLHILQHDLNKSADMCTRRMKSLLKKFSEKELKALIKDECNNVTQFVCK